jgi:peptidoglycan/LPS O-acetylase OafA/YrhL
MALDGLRGFAVLSVVFVHCALPGFPGGTHGVDVFFVLSGYLITTLLVAESERPETVDIRAFWRRRFRRLMPALAALVLAYVAIAPLLLPEVAHLRWRDAAAALTYTMNLDLLAERRMTGLGHLWSLALEAQFYLLWPAVVLLLRRLRNPAPRC